MNHLKRIEGIWKAPAHKRYKTMITTVADRELVWFHEGDAWEIWPGLEFASMLYKEQELLCVDVHDFCDDYLNRAIDASLDIIVFPTEIDSFVVSPQRLKEDLMFELSLIE